MQGWPKTSGGRGVHIYVPIQPRWTFQEVRRSVIAFGRELERRLPDRVTMNWWKEERGEKIFIDYNQMARDRTIASAYSIRPKPHAPVSAPLDWDELPDVSPFDFDVLTMPARFPRSATSTPASADHAFGIEPLLELAERQEQRPGARRDALAAGLPEDAGRADAGAAQPRQAPYQRGQLDGRLTPSNTALVPRAVARSLEQRRGPSNGSEAVSEGGLWDTAPV